MIWRIWSLPPPAAEAVAAVGEASSWKAPVSHTVATVDSAAATSGGQRSAATAYAAAPRSPTITPMTGNQMVERARYSASCPTHAGQGSRVRNITAVRKTRR
jgi:hypothetical protein